MDTVVLVLLALMLAAIFVVFTVAFATVWREIAQLISLVSYRRSNKRFFKKIEGFRRDFTE